MEVFSLLKYWRTSGGDANVNANVNANANVRTNVTSTTTTTIRHVADNVGEDDEGPFFDLEFTLPPEEHESDVSGSDSEVEEEEEEVEELLAEREGEFDFTVDSSVSTGNLTDPNLSLSPSDDLFFNGRFVPLEPSELSFSSTESHSKLQFPGSLLKPATKLRVLMLGFKKPKSTEKSESKQSKSSFTVKLKVEEVQVPIVSLFTRDNSSRNSNKIKLVEEAEEKKFAKDVLQKYLKMVKPLYFKVSRNKSSPVGFSGHLSPISSPEIKESEANSTVKIQKEGNLTAGLRNVRKHLGKSRSASSAVAAAPTTVQSRRHDDSLLQQQDGIQSAILHCKRSFTASRDSDSSGLSRSTSDPCYEKSKVVNRSNS